MYKHFSDRLKWLKPADVCSWSGLAYLASGLNSHEHRSAFSSRNYPHQSCNYSNTASCRLCVVQTDNILVLVHFWNQRTLVLSDELAHIHTSLTRTQVGGLYHMKVKHNIWSWKLRRQALLIIYSDDDSSVWSTSVTQGWDEGTRPASSLLARRLAILKTDMYTMISSTCSSWSWLLGLMFR